MQTQEIERLITTGIPGARVQVEDTVGDGNHFQAIIVSEQFEGLSMIRQHQLVYSTLQSLLDDGTLHALALKTYTPDQWQRSLVQLG